MWGEVVAALLVFLKDVLKEFDLAVVMDTLTVLRTDCLTVGLTAA